MSKPQFSPSLSSPHHSDDDAIRRTQAGDPKAFDDLIRKYYTPLYGLIYNITFHHEDTNDLLQETFAKAYSSINKFQFKSSFYTWIYRIAINKSLNFIKKHRRYKHTSFEEATEKNTEIQLDAQLVDHSTEGNPHYFLNHTELQKKLNKALLKLSESHRIVVLLFDIQGIAQAEIAKMLKINEGTVRSRLFYAHKQLKTYLKEFDVKK